MASAGPLAGPVGKMKYFVIAAGVDNSPGQNPLSYAEKDAQDIHRVFTSAVGPDPEARLLLGANAHGNAIQQAFFDAWRAKPDFLTIYFSGHGDENVLAVGDGLFRHSDLVDLIRLVNAPHTLIILDVCRAASFWGWIKEAAVGYAGVPEPTWFDVLAEATPSTRMMFSTGPLRTAGERADLQNGTFTHGLMRALGAASPTLPHEQPVYVSDITAFDSARKFVRGIDPLQTPLAVGLTGDFPMVKSQMTCVIGDASIHGVTVHPHHIEVFVQVEERQKIETKCVVTLVNKNGKVLHHDACELRPSGGDATYKFVYPVPTQSILGDITSRVFLLTGPAPLTLNVRLLDGAGDALAQSFYSLQYRK